MLWSAGHCEGQHRGLPGPRAEVHKQLCLASHFTFKGGCGFEAAGQVSCGLASDRTNLIEDVRTQNVGNQRGRHNTNNWLLMP